MFHWIYFSCAWPYVVLVSCNFVQFISQLPPYYLRKHDVYALPHHYMLASSQWACHVLSCSSQHRWTQRQWDMISSDPYSNTQPNFTQREITFAVCFASAVTGLYKPRTVHTGCTSQCKNHKPAIFSRLLRVDYVSMSRSTPALQNLEDRHLR